MIKNLKINYLDKAIIPKKLIHEEISLLKKELKFELDSLSINFVDADTIKNININYLNHHYSTDIITFNYTGDNAVLDGEMFISVDDAADYAAEYKVTLKEELLRLVIHGILHLVGYDDMNVKDKKIMKKLENEFVVKHKDLIIR